MQTQKYIMIQIRPLIAIVTKMRISYANPTETLTQKAKNTRTVSLAIKIASGLIQGHHRANSAAPAIYAKPARKLNQNTNGK